MSNRIPIMGAPSMDITFGWTVDEGGFREVNAVVLAVMLDGDGAIPSLRHAVLPGQDISIGGAVATFGPLSHVHEDVERMLGGIDPEFRAQTFRVELAKLPEQVRHIRFLLHVDDARNSNLSSADVKSLVIAGPGFSMHLDEGDEAARSRWIAEFRMTDEGWVFFPLAEVEEEEGIDVIDALLLDRQAS